MIRSALRPILFGGAPNLVTNGSFEADASGWTTTGTNTIARSTTQSHSGAASLLCTYGDTIAFIPSFALTLTPVLHTWSAWLWIPTAYDGTQLQLQMPNFAGSSGTTSVLANMALKDQWQQLTGKFAPAATDVAGQIRVVETVAPTVGRFFYLDDVVVRRSA